MEHALPGRTQAEVVVADIGSTLTKLSAFAGLTSSAGPHTGQAPQFLGQGVALTTVAAGNVVLGLQQARQALEATCAVDTAGARLMASASAAGGLRMTVHGLTQDMTLRAAREASLGAGAVVTFTTAGRLSADDLAEIRQRQPNLILLAGGVDDGERDVVLANARALAALGLETPIIYAGNQAVRGEVQRLLQSAQVPVFLVDNVYPRLDELHLEPVRRLIQDVFARHIITAPGMEQVKTMVTGNVMPTPGAVLRATELLAEVLGDVLTIDVGGATTDVHSVTEGSSVYARLRLAPEPHSKRTVEGDLGVYLNAAHLAAAAGEAAPAPQHIMPIPAQCAARRMTVDLTRWAVDIAVWRHAGALRAVYGAYGRHELVEGRDLTAIRYVIGTGGALTRLDMGQEILRHIKADPSQRKLLPPAAARVLVDQHYIMAAAGVLSQYNPKAATALLLASLGLSREEAHHGWTLRHD